MLPSSTANTEAVPVCNSMCITMNRFHRSLRPLTVPKYTVGWLTHRIVVRRLLFLFPGEDFDLLSAAGWSDRKTSVWVPCCGCLHG